jgi:CRP/FNR family cyclic AMP-dependent transcriptional regulator
LEISPVALLKQVPIFGRLDEASLGSLASHSRRRKFRGGEALFHEGDPGHTLYVIAEGRVNIQTTTAEGQTVHLAQRTQGEHFGEMALIDGKPRMADAVTAERCDLIMLDRADFVRCIEESPKIALGVMASLADRLREAADSLETRQGLDVLGRVSGLLLEIMEVNNSPHPKGGKRIESKLTQTEMAERIGSTRETVNRALASLRDVRAIKMNGRQIVVLDEERLRKYYES